MSVANWEAGRTEPRITKMPAVLKFLDSDPLPAAVTLAENLVNRRRMHGITQEGLARRLGVDPGTLARWERGDRMPSGRFLPLVEAWLERHPAD